MQFPLPLYPLVSVTKAQRGILRMDKTNTEFRKTDLQGHLAEDDTRKMGWIPLRPKDAGKGNFHPRLVH